MHKFKLSAAFSFAYCCRDCLHAASCWDVQGIQIYKFTSVSMPNSSYEDAISYVFNESWYLGKIAWCVRHCTCSQCYAYRFLFIFWLMPGWERMSAQQLKSEKKFIEERVAKVREVVHTASNNDIILALHNYDFDVNKTIQAFCDGSFETGLKDCKYRISNKGKSCCFYVLQISVCCIPHVEQKCNNHRSDWCIQRNICIAVYTTI